MAFEQDIIAKLQAAGFGALGTQIFLGSKADLPTGNGPFLHLRTYGGKNPLRRQNTLTPAFVRPSMQLNARAKDYYAARDMAHAAYNALIGVRNETINGVFYREIDAVQEPFDGGEDDNERIQFIFNINVIREYTS